MYSCFTRSCSTHSGFLLENIIAGTVSGTGVYSRHDLNQMYMSYTKKKRNDKLKRNTYNCTKTNMKPANRPGQKQISFGNYHFQAPNVRFQTGKLVPDITSEFIRSSTPRQPGFGNNARNTNLSQQKEILSLNIFMYFCCPSSQYIIYNMIETIQGSTMECTSNLSRFIYHESLYNIQQKTMFSPTCQYCFNTIKNPRFMPLVRPLAAGTGRDSPATSFNDKPVGKAQPRLKLGDVKTATRDPEANSI